MEVRNFVFDIIVTHFQAYNVKIEDLQKLAVKLKFNSSSISVSSSRINVSDFKHGSSTEYFTTFQAMRAGIEECGLAINVFYKNVLLGSGQINFPQDWVNNITDGMPELVHSDSCEFEMNGEVVGNLGIMCRLLIKCDFDPALGPSECRRNVNKSINPNDILFVMAESQKCPVPCDPCLDAWEPMEGDDQFKLDLGRYRSVEMGTLKNEQVFMHNPTKDSACAEIRKMADEYKEVMNSILKSVGEPQSPCRTAESLRSPCSSPCKNEATSNLVKPESTSSIPRNLFAQPDDNVLTMPDIPNDNWKDPFKRNIRFCHTCLNSMNWMPTMAACPKCQIKPMLYADQPVREEKINVDQIISDYLEKSSTADKDPCSCAIPKKDDEKKDEILPETGCSCKYGKLCAYCRVRQPYPDFYHPEKKKPSPKMEDEIEIDLAGEYCYDKKFDADRPFLARVFSELRELYNINDVVERPDKANERKNTTAVDKSPINSEIHIKTKKVPPVKQDATKSPQVKHDSSKIPAKHNATTKSNNSGLHRNCANTPPPVSRRHGWAWSSTQEARKYGWRPGAVLRSIKRIIDHFSDTPQSNALSICKQQMKSDAEKERDLPILNLSRQKGEIVITLRPINDPNMKMNPIVFKVVKSDQAVAVSEIKKKLKDKGFTKCTCHQTVMMCTCRNAADKKCLENALEKECKRRNIVSCVDELVLTDTSENDSEMDFNFNVTPPAGVAKPPSRPKAKTVNNGTQTATTDLNVTPMYPVRMDSYHRAYDCAAGGRYAPTAFGFPAEKVFEDGIFGFGGGGPHGVLNVCGARKRHTCVPKGMVGGRGGGGRGGAGGRPGGMFGDKSFPGAPKKSGEPGKPIPVRMLQRYINAVKAAEQAEKDAIQNEIARKKKGIDVMRYLMSKGTIETPWDPNNPKPKNAGPPPGPVVGPDGLTDAQRKRRAMQQMCIPPLDSMPRLGKAIDPCRCYYPCGTQCCYPCGPQCCYPGCYYC